LVMNKGSGKSQVNNRGLDLEHELPAGSEDGDSSTVGASAGASSADLELQALKAERDSLLDRLARMQAEFKNARQRADKEQQEYREYAVAEAIKSLLPVVDSLERAVQVRSDASDLRSGIDLIYKQLMAALAKLSVNPLLAKGEAFDPRFHEAIEMVETNEAPDQEVVEELQRGYKFKERLLRPAMVKVAKNS
jgi:molecular chaperone GrpE